MNTKRKGNRNEHKTMRLLESLGYCCTRAAASLGVWDVIAIGPNDTKLVQVKSNRRPGSVELEAMRMFRNPPNSSKELWIWHDHKRQPVVEVL